MNFKKYHVSKNLWDYLPNAELNGVALSSTDGLIRFSGICTGSVNFQLLKELPAGTYALKTNANRVPINDNNACIQVIIYNTTRSATVLNRNAVDGSDTLILSTNSQVQFRIRIQNGVDYTGFEIRPMLNTGSTPLPYEPYSSEVWHDIPYYQHKTATDTLTLPAVIYPNDTTITVGLKGNEEHTGTPSPQNPVVINGTGERTAQLIPEIVQGGVSTSNGSFSNSSNRVRTNYIPVESGKTYAVSSGNLYLATGCYYNNGVFSSKIDEVVGVTTSATFTVPENVNQIAIGFRTANDITNITPSDLQNYMLNEGSTALPYEPYGIKIPILLNSQTINKYLGTEQTERQIRKLVLTGQENWQITSNGAYYLGGSDCPKDYLKSNIITVICSHYEGQTNTGSGSNEVNTGCICFYTRSGYELYIGERTIRTAADFKTYLQQQYANGTPVCVWYVLATPQTAVVNEPLMKIGTYADSLSTTIPCTAGENTLDVQTTVQPSEVTAGFSGWHPVQSVHERENGQWD